MTQNDPEAVSTSQTIPAAYTSLHLPMGSSKDAIEAAYKVRVTELDLAYYTLIEAFDTQKPYYGSSMNGEAPISVSATEAADQEMLASNSDRQTRREAQDAALRRCEARLREDMAALERRSEEHKARMKARRAEREANHMMRLREIWQASADRALARQAAADAEDARF